MLTPFGIQIRKVRLDKGLRLLDMAAAVERTSAFLSAIETGKKPIPEGFEHEIARAFNLNTDERSELVRAADRTRKEVKVSRLPGSERELVAAIARRVDTMSPEDIEILRRLVFKMSGDEVPFFRRKRGTLVAGRSMKDIWNTADMVRKIFGVPGEMTFPIMDVIEFRLERFLPGFYIEVSSKSELNGDEARAVPGENTIIFSETVYERAWKNDGRSRFTAAHELGHLLMHRNVMLARSSTEFPIYRDAEWQADCFAGGLLMPQNVVQKFADPGEMALECGVTFSAAEVMWRKYGR